MGLPNINILFKEMGITAVQRGTRGIVALILKDSTHNGFINVQTIDEIPSDLSDYNKKQIQLALMGTVNAPSLVICYIESDKAADYTQAMTALESVKWNYLAVPQIASSDALAIATWIKGLRDTKDIKVKAVLPNTAADDEGIINFATDNIVSNSTTYSAADYCGRIAGILAGLPLTISSTYQVLSEVTDVPHLSKTDFDTAINAGKLVLINDGEKVKIARGVNSLVTITSDKSADFEKIKLVDTMDQIHDDIKKAVSDNYIGKVPNTYDNKALLITAIQAYYEGLEAQQILDTGKNTVDVDIAAQKNYLMSIGVDVTKLNDQQIKESNTHDRVFLSSSIKIIDAIEDIALNIGL